MKSMNKSLCIMCHPSTKPVLLVFSNTPEGLTPINEHSAHEDKINIKLYIFSENSIEITYSSANGTLTFLYHKVKAVEDVSKVLVTFQKRGILALCLFLRRPPYFHSTISVSGLLKIATK